jgi:hypothetical protein
MDAVRFPRASVAYDHHGRERALSAAVPLSPRALFEAIRQRKSAYLHAHGTPDPDGEIASVNTATEMLAYAYDHALAMEEKLRQCRHAHTRGMYVAPDEHAVYAAFARYIGCVEAAAARSGSGSSALAAFHRAMPVEQRDDEWRAVDAVLHHHHRYQ